MDMSVEVLPGLTLKDPFMIASSHRTESEGTFRKLQAVSPCAVTLKSTSSTEGGDGTHGFGQRQKMWLEDSAGNRFGQFTDGLKIKELLDIPTTYTLTQTAKKLLPDTVIGLSVMQGEPYGDIATHLNLADDYGYVELNLKYFFREISWDSVNDRLDELISDVKLFFEAFGSRPTLIKISREMTPFMRMSAMDALLDEICGNTAAIIISNSLRIRVPPSSGPSSRPELAELNSGVVVGEHLFLDTYDTIRSLSRRRLEQKPVPAIIASGGIIDVGGVVDVLAAGASAVQLCSALDQRGVHVLPLLRLQLAHLIGDAGSYSAFCAQLVDEAVWKQAAGGARTFRVIARDTVTSVFSDANRMNEVIHATVQAEIADPISVGATEALRQEPPEGLNIIYSSGNLSTYLLAKACAESLGLEARNYLTCADFVEQLKDDTFQWDIGLLPASSLEYLRRNKAEMLGDRAPIQIVPVAKSVFELVGTQQELTSIQRVYFFGGRSSRAALERLLREQGFFPDVHVLKGEELFSLLCCWQPANGILAKPPLSQLYGYCADQESSLAWRSIWSTSEDIVLVISRRFSQMECKGSALAALGKALEDERARLVESPEYALRRLKGFGYMSYLSKLLSGKELVS